jgi:phosphatidate phosphatase APP1
MSGPFAIARLLVGLIVVILSSSVLPGLVHFAHGADEEVLVAPTFAVYDPEAGVYRVHAHVWVYEPEADSLLRNAFVKELRDEVAVREGTPEAKIFDRRIRRFLVDNEGHQKVVIHCGEQHVELGRTAANGHIRGMVTFPEQGAPAKQLKLRYSVDDGEVDVEQTVPVLATKGLSVVSDIDDTIKVSHVLDRKKLLEKTFMSEFQPVPGMATAYRKLAGTGASFHYLSSSPWQLFAPLDAFRAKAGFPSGTFHLRIYRPGSIRSNLDFMGDSQPYKLRNLRRLLGETGEREFILVGDAGEKDPEIYGTIARAFPGRVRAIYIRKVKGADLTKKRFATAFHGVRIPTVVFDDPSKIVARPPASSSSKEEQRTEPSDGK